MKNILYLIGLGAGLFGQPFLFEATADTFGSGVDQFQIDFVQIGSPGNLPDTTDRPVTDGAVSYEYRIGKYEISEDMIDKANSLGALGITHDGRGGNFPATSISWFEAAKFVNWLNDDSGHPVAYKFDARGAFQVWESTDPGYDPSNRYRNSLAHYLLPTISEWHKAAYYDPIAEVYYDYPTGSDAIPDGIDSVGDMIFDAVFFDGVDNGGPNVVTSVGLLSPYATFAQGGNVSEWIESAFDRSNSDPTEGRLRKGGSWNFSASLLAASNDGIGTNPLGEFNWIGFRVGRIVPEPSTILILGISLPIVIFRRRR